MDGNSLGLGRLEEGQRVSVHVGLDQRAADLAALGLHEGVRHAAADDQLVDAIQQVLQHGQLGAHLGATNHGGHRLFRTAEHLLQRFDLTLHEEAKSLVLREETGNHRCRGVGAVCRAERIVDVEVPILGQLAGKELIPGLLLSVEAEVLQDGNLTGSEGLRHLQGLVAHAVGSELHRTAEVALQRRDDVAKGQVGIGSLWTTEVAHQDHAAPRVEHMLDGRQGGADARVVGHSSAAVLGRLGHRNVEVNADQGAHAVKGEVLKGHDGGRGGLHGGGESKGNQENRVDQPTRSATRAGSSAIGTRTCSMVSRSRRVTALSSRVSWSMVMHSGVPMASWRR